MTAFASSADVLIPPAPTLAPTLHEQIGFELGWDHARHRVVPPAPYAAEPSPLRDGLAAGRAAFGARALPAGRAVRQWLHLRLHAWLRGRSVELFQVTPHYLQQIQASHCPITRVALAGTGAGAGDASVDRVRNDAGYAAGNLAVMSRRANLAKAACRFRDALGVVERLHAAAGAGDAPAPQPPAEAAGLGADAWGRIAVLCSFVEPLAHAEAAGLPLLVLPPNRLRLLNPVQALQAMVSRQLLRAGWSRRLARFEELLPGKALQGDFKRFVMALLPRVLEAGKLADSAATRWAIEDAWRSPLVLQRWSRFALQLHPAQCESLLQSAAIHGLATTGIEPMRIDQATDGWNLAARGYVAPETAERAESGQAQFAF